MEGNLKIIDLGLIAYDSAWNLQQKFLSDIRAGTNQHALIFCNHYPVITCGSSFAHGDILASDTTLARMGISVRRVNRGGGVTYHGPGQLTVYPVFNLNFLRKDLRWFNSLLEQAVINTLGLCGVNAQRRSGFPGVWVKQRKICSIGLGVSNWVTYHGLSLNLSREDMRAYSLIRPCGSDSVMTCLEDESSNGVIEREAVKDILLGCLRVLFWPAGINANEERTQEALG